VGVRDRASVVIKRGGICFVLTSALAPDGPISEHVNVHGDSVKDIALEVVDAGRAFETAIARGAREILPPTVFEDDDGRIVKATIATCGHCVHSFIQREGYQGRFFPGYRALANQPTAPATGLNSIDHIAIGVEPGKLEEVIAFYDQVMSLRQSHHEDIVTEYSGMNSKVVQNNNGLIKFPVMEPAAGKRRSQIDEYLDFHHGPGVQHIALATDDIFDTARTLRANGIEFLSVPADYYDRLPERLGAIEDDIESLRSLSILIDRDEWGELMQIFTKPMQDRPTLFLEVIQRKGAQGFGSGNIKALFEAIEREQDVRGNL
jgi:4-hydroxyphenylpyruvate dioxygenase